MENTRFQNFQYINSSRIQDYRITIILNHGEYKITELKSCNRIKYGFNKFLPLPHPINIENLLLTNFKPLKTPRETS